MEKRQSRAGIKQSELASPYILVAEAANLARVSEATVRYWLLNEKHLRPRKIGRRVLISRAELLDLIESSAYE